MPDTLEALAYVQLPEEALIKRLANLYINGPLNLMNVCRKASPKKGAFRDLMNKVSDEAERQRQVGGARRAAWMGHYDKDFHTLLSCPGQVNYRRKWPHHSWPDGQGPVLTPYARKAALLKRYFADPSIWMEHGERGQYSSVRLLPDKTAVAVAWGSYRQKQWSHNESYFVYRRLGEEPRAWRITSTIRKPDEAFEYLKRAEVKRAEKDGLKVTVDWKAHAFSIALINGQIKSVPWKGVD